MIKTFLGIFAAGKKQVKSNFVWSDDLEKLKNLPDNLENTKNQGLISYETTKEEFALRFKHLTYTRLAAFLGLVFSGGKALGTQNLMGTMTSTLAIILFLFIFIQYSYKSWVCECIWNAWPKRQHLKKPRFLRFIATLFKKPQILLHHTLR